jgi:hypothetical protein
MGVNVEDTLERLKALRGELVDPQKIDLPEGGQSLA